LTSKTTTLVPPAKSRLFVAYVGLALLMASLASWLAVDFSHERKRILDQSARLAVHKSQLISRALGDTFLAADYVLRDLLSRVDVTRDLTHSTAAPGRASSLKVLLQDKAATVAGVSEIVLLNKDCRLAVTAFAPLEGTGDPQPFCSQASVPSGQSVHIQYVSREKSIVRRPVLLMSRIIGSPEGRLLGGATAAIDLNYAQKWLSDLSIETNDFMAVLDTDGFLLARTPYLPELIGERIAAPDGMRVFGGADNTASLLSNSAIDGRERVLGLSRMDTLPFVAIVGIDSASALEGWNYRATQFAIGFLVLLAISVWALRAHLDALAQREHLHQLATTDALTGIANRHHLLEVAAREFSRAQRYEHPLSVLMIDIDRFKSINDRWGHATGDRVIQEMARLMQDVARDPDVSGRLGGEEFVVVLPETDLHGAQVVAERLRRAVEASEQVSADTGGALRFTVSIGVATLDVADTSFQAALERADAALYQAKTGGRNRVVAAEPSPH
jgi:diguanylate cyclase (GGDEF)-like protein